MDNPIIIVSFIMILIIIIIFLSFLSHSDLQQKKLQLKDVDENVLK